MAITFHQAADGLQRMAGSANTELQRSLQQVAEAVIPHLRDLTPVQTGNLRDSWGALGTSVINDAGYATHVRDGMIRTLVPTAVAELDARWTDDIDDRLRRSGSLTNG